MATFPLSGTWAGMDTRDNDRLSKVDWDDAAFDALVNEVIAMQEEAVRVAIVTATLDQIKADYTLITGVTGKAITVLDCVAHAAGNAGTATSVDVQSTNGTPVKVLVYLVAALTDGAIVYSNEANVSEGAGWQTALGSGDGVEVVDVGGVLDTTTSIKFVILYQMKDA